MSKEEIPASQRINIAQRYQPLIFDIGHWISWSTKPTPIHIRVNTQLPGFTDTKFSSVLMQNEAICKMVVDQIPLKRHAEPSEMSGAVLYLVSDAASDTTGACLTSDGGLLFLSGIILKGH